MYGYFSTLKVRTWDFAAKVERLAWGWGSAESGKKSSPFERASNSGQVKLEMTFFWTLNVYIYVYVHMYLLT